MLSLRLTGLPDSVFDWTRESDSKLSSQNANNQAFSRKHWRLLQCQNGDLFSITCCTFIFSTACMISSHPSIRGCMTSWRQKFNHCSAIVGTYKLQYSTFSFCLSLYGRTPHFWRTYWSWLPCMDHLHFSIIWMTWFCCALKVISYVIICGLCAAAKEL